MWSHKKTSADEGHKSETCKYLTGFHGRLGLLRGKTKVVQNIDVHGVSFTAYAKRSSQLNLKGKRVILIQNFRVLSA